MIHYRGADVRAALAGLAGEAGDPYEGITLRFVNPANGAPVFPDPRLHRAAPAAGRRNPRQARDREHACTR